MKASLLALAILSDIGPAFADHPIAGVNWILVDSLPRDCWAETDVGGFFGQGNTMHIKIMPKNGGDVELVGTGLDWQIDGPTDFEIRIDNRPSMEWHGRGTGHLVFVPIDDSTLRQLREASYLVWRVPSGDFIAKIAGFGTALDAALQCRRGKRGDG